MISLPQVQFSSTELQEVAITMQNPALRKYLINLVHNSLIALGEGSRQTGETAESFLERRAAVQGGMVAIEQLLLIQPAAIS